MFAGNLQPFDPNLQSLVLLINTMLLIGALITLELVYTDAPKTQKANRRLYYPFIVVMVGLLFVAGYQQLGGS